jgi:acetyl-CoA decarbonylase/synthase complex subunit gamma
MSEEQKTAVVQVGSRWTWRDYLGALRVRLCIGREHYRVPPGLYAVGQPGPAAPLFASANYRLSFNHLRRALAGMDAWIVVLDTKGINVWCAAGKGTFGTDELVERLAAVDAAQRMEHKTVIVPQLGATGVAAHEVKQRSGFKVVYGPVRATDIPAFLAAGMCATPAMRQVTFPVGERLLVVPVEAVHRLVPAGLVLAGFFLASGLGRHGYRLATEQWPALAVAVVANVVAGILLVPAFLPLLPGRAFAMKGAVVGLATGAALWWWAGYRPVEGLAVLLMSLAACSFLGLEFTGCSTYTSPSGVRREMRWALRMQIGAAAVGLILWLVARFV